MFMRCFIHLQIFTLTRNKILLCLTEVREFMFMISMVIDIEGLSGLWCNALGFGNEELIEAASVQMRKLSYGTLFASKSHEPAILLAEKLIELSPFNEGKVFFGSSGSDANDTQIKIFTYLNNATGKKNKKNFLSLIHI